MAHDKKGKPFCHCHHHGTVFIMQFILITISLLDILPGSSLSLVSAATDSNFDPFMDSNLFFIKWNGPLEMTSEEIEKLGDRHVKITTNHKEKYECILPETKSGDENDAASYTGPTPLELLGSLMGSSHCSYRIESYWTYELCHGKHLKQYHETKEQGSSSKIQEYYLGYGNHLQELKDKEGEQEVEDKTAPLPVRDLDGVELPYLEIVMNDGTKCDLTGTPRRAHVLYVCQSEGRGEVYELKESSTCEYEVVVLTSLLCSHPRYRPKTPPVSEIQCHAMPGSGLKPKELYKVNMEQNYLIQSAGKTHNLPSQRGPRVVRKQKQTLSTEDKMSADSRPGAEPVRKPPTPATVRRAPEPANTLGHITDTQTLRAFLSGSHCLTGGAGWWKHEICFGRHAKQYHIDRKTGVETKIYLGHWHEEDHMMWLNDNPNRRPKAPAERSWISLMYSHGDTCDLTNQPRNCEVRLKCINNLKNPHAVIVSLQEPASCSYILTVESNLFCPVLKEADENGLIDVKDL